MLVETGYWPAGVPFDMDELVTVVSVINDRAKEARRGRNR